MSIDTGTFFRPSINFIVADSFRAKVISRVKFSEKSRATATKSILLEREMFDQEIELSIGPGHLFTEESVFDTIYEMIQEQDGGKVGKLLNNGRANLFYLDSCVAYVRWSAGFRQWEVATFDRGAHRWNVYVKIFFPASPA